MSLRALYLVFAHFQICMFDLYICLRLGSFVCGLLVSLFFFFFLLSPLFCMARFDYGRIVPIASFLNEVGAKSPLTPNDGREVLIYALWEQSPR